MPPSTLTSSIGVLCATGLGASSQAVGHRSTLGLVKYCFNLAARHHKSVAGTPDFTDPLVFIREAARAGATAVQIDFGICDADRTWAIRDAAERSEVALESIVALPKDNLDLERFGAELGTLQNLGVKIARTVLLPGRRYEQFASILDYANAMRVATKALSDAEKLARAHGIFLALENHKDQTTEERLALLEQFNSEHIGVCLDLGNNISLLEDPIETARAFAPWIKTVHFKDQAVREYEDGFLLADVPVGQGSIDLRKVIEIVRQHKPEARFHLELITRDALEVPVFQESYWRTLNVLKASKLAATLAMLKNKTARGPFLSVSNLPASEQVRLERENIEQSLRYSVEQLGL